MRRVAPVCCAMICACSHGQKLADGIPAFIQLESEHFRVRTDASDADARRALVELERVRTAFGIAPWPTASPPPGKLDVIELADVPELQEFAGQNVSGYIANDALGERLVIITAEQSPSQLPVLKHELAHYVSDSILSHRPSWLAEGVACYLETLRLDASEDRFVVGEVDQQRIRFLLAHPVRNWNEILQMRSRYLTADRQDTYAFESASWLLFHWLFNDHRDELNAYVRALARGTPFDRAFRDSFPTLTEQAIAEQTNAHAQPYARYVKMVFPLPRWDGAISVRPLTPAEVHATRAELFFLSPGRSQRRFDRARGEAMQALATDAGEPEAAAVLARLPEASPDESRERFRTAVKLHPDDPRGWVLLLGALREHGESSQRHDAVAQALRVAPREPRILVAATWDALEEGRFAEALARAGDAVKLAPHDVRSLDAFAFALAANGRCADSVQVESRTLDVLPEGAPAAIVEHFHKRIELLQKGEPCRRPGR